jgi:hypothetical protein
MLGAVLLLGACGRPSARSDQPGHPATETRPPTVCSRGNDTATVKSDCVPEDQVDSAWLRPDSNWTLVDSKRWGIELRVPPGTAVRLRGPATTACADSVPPRSGPRSRVVEGSSDDDALLLRIYFTRASFEGIADRAGFTRYPNDERWWLAGSQQAGVATPVGEAGRWRGLDAVAMGEFGEFEPEHPRFGAREDAGAGMYDLRVAVAVFPRADGCQVVIEAWDTNVARTLSRLFQTVRLGS